MNSPTDPQQPYPGAGPGPVPYGYVPAQPTEPVKLLGRSRALSISIGAGVLCGVVLGVVVAGDSSSSAAATATDEADAATVASASELGGTDPKPERDPPTVTEAQPGVGGDDSPPVAAGTEKPSAPLPAEDSQPVGTKPGASPPSAGSVEAPPVQEAPAPAAQQISALLSFSVTPANAPGLTITVQGQQVVGDSHAFTIPKPKKVRIVARARGYRTWSKTVFVNGDKSVQIRLRRPFKSQGGPGGSLDL